METIINVLAWNTSKTADVNQTLSTTKTLTSPEINNHRICTVNRKKLLNASLFSITFTWFSTFTQEIARQSLNIFWSRGSEFPINNDRKKFTCTHWCDLWIKIENNWSN